MSDARFDGAARWRFKGSSGGASDLQRAGAIRLFRDNGLDARQSLTGMTRTGIVADPANRWAHPRDPSGGAAPLQCNSQQAEQALQPIEALLQPPLQGREALLQRNVGEAFGR